MKLLNMSNFTFFHNVFHAICILKSFKLLPNDKFFDITKLKAFAYDKFNIAKMTISLCDRVENTVGKEENAGYQHFFLFPHFQGLLLSGR